MDRLVVRRIAQFVKRDGVGGSSESWRRRAADERKLVDMRTQSDEDY